MRGRTFYSAGAFAGRGVKAAGSPQSVIILATIKNVQTRRQCVRVRSLGLVRIDPPRSSSFLLFLLLPPPSLRPEESFACSRIRE